jgi:hypothetical protein
MPSQALALACLCFRFVEGANPNAIRCVGDPSDPVGDPVGDPSDDVDVDDVVGDSLIFYT